ncbi:MAG: hypothetical protein ACTSYI_09260 [Promethearchaeota archaeon]
MTDYANMALIFAGLFPLIYSAVKVEKYYTEYYKGLENIFGSTLVILGFILDTDVSWTMQLIGWITILVFWVIFAYSRIKDNPDLIRSLGWSSVQFSIDLFFIVFYFLEKIEFALTFSLFSLILLISLRLQIKQNHGPRRYRSSYNYHGRRKIDWEKILDVHPIIIFASSIVGFLLALCFFIDENLQTLNALNFIIPGICTILEIWFVVHNRDE